MTAKDNPNLPKFVVLGQGKAGTTLIYRVLKNNPLIGLSEPKELHFFSARFNKGLDWYARHFAHVSPETQLVGEVSPSYLAAQPIQRIAEVLGRQTKVIFVLRRPIERAYSRYLQNICADQRPGTFFGADRALPGHMDALQEAIRTAYDLFGPTNVLPLFFEKDIACQTPTFEAQILNFLGLPNADHAGLELAGKPVNPGTMPRYLYSGENGLSLSVEAKRFKIPPRHLVFCGQRRNSWAKENPDPSEIVDALHRQSTWTPAISRNEYRRMLERAVLPAADRLEKEFGFDLAHWRCAPRHIAYDPAPPPASFLKKPAAQSGTKPRKRG